MGKKLFENENYQDLARLSLMHGHAVGTLALQHRINAEAETVLGRLGGIGRGRHCAGGIGAAAIDRVGRMGRLRRRGCCRFTPGLVGHGVGLGTHPWRVRGPTLLGARLDSRLDTRRRCDRVQWARCGRYRRLGNAS